MIPAHGAVITVSSSDISVDYSPLLVALENDSFRVDITEVSDIEIVPPTNYVSGKAILHGTDKAIEFAPGTAESAQALLEAWKQAKTGDLPGDVAAATTIIPEAASDESDSGIDSGITAPATGNQATGNQATGNQATGNQAKIKGLNFVAFDVETANDDWGSVCQFGLVKVTDGQLGETASWLCTPPDGLDDFHPANVEIHGITSDDVKGQPSFAECLAKMVEFVGDLPLVAHNAQFDFTAISRGAKAAKTEIPNFRFGCTLALARAKALGTTNHKLPTVAAGLGHNVESHHNAASDAIACAHILIALARRDHFEGPLEEYFYSSGFTLGELDSTRVFPVLRDRSGAGAISQRKKFGLAAPATAPGSASSSDALFDAPASALPSEPERTEPQEPRQSSRRAPWSKVSTPDVIPEPNADADPEGILFGENVTLTGDFEPHDKGELWNNIAHQGGTVAKNVTKKTTILVCGQWATKTSKEKRAEELIAKGQDIKIWTAEQLYTAMGLDEEPPF